MSEKEEGAIERLKNRQGFRYDSKCIRCGKGATIIIPPEVLYGKEIDIVLNYIDKLEKEIKELKEDISNMYYEEVVISIMCDNFNITRLEALELLGDDE